MDKILREKLDQLRPEYDSASWEVLSSNLDSELPTQMDESIKAKLDGIDTSLQPQGWAAMSSHLDDLDAEDLDHVIKDKLESIDVDYSASSWTVLESKMQILADEELDDLVREKVTHQSRQSASESWATLLEKLEAWEQVRREFWVMRSAEALIILLLLLAVYQYGPLLPHYGPMAGIEHPITDQLLKIQGEHVKDVKEIDVSAISPVETIEENAPATIGQTAIDNDSQSSSEGAISTSHIEASQMVGSVHQDRNEDKRNTNSLKNESKGKGAENVVAVSEKEAFVGQIEEDSPKPWLIQENQPIAGEDEVGITKQLPLISSMLISTMEQQNRFTEMVPAISSTKRPIWLSLQSHAVLNRVHTPANDEFDAQNAHTLGYGIGLLLGFTHEKLTWETGLEYQFTIFRPKRTKLTGSVVDGYRSTTLSEVNLDYINIPLQARYTLVDNDQHQLYGMAGVKLHISSKVDFDFLEERDQDNQVPIDFQKEPDSEDILGVNRGRFNYFSVNVGVGYQYLINTRTAIFVQPSYEHFAEKRGITNLNGEKVNSLRVDFGARVKL